MHACSISRMRAICARKTASGPTRVNMRRSVAYLFALSFLGIAFVAATWALVYRLTPEHRRRQMLRWLTSWSVKGLVLPISLWVVLNLGISFELQPLIPAIQYYKQTGGP